MDWRTLFLSPEGRIGRKAFWTGFVIVMGASLIIGVIPILGQLIGLVMLWPQVCIHAKRLHDMDRNAWLMAIPFGISVVCFPAAILIAAPAMTGGTGEPTGMGLAIGLAAFAMLVSLAFLLWVGLTRGTPGPNRFGDPPAR